MTRANDMCIVSTRWKTLASLESMIHFYFDEYETCLNIRPTNLHCCSSNENLPLIFSKRLKSARTSTKPQLSESLLTELQTICSAWQWINKMWFDWSKNFFQNVTYHRELFYGRDLGARSDKKLVDLSKSFNSYFTENVSQVSAPLSTTDHDAFPDRILLFLRMVCNFVKLDHTVIG